MSKLADTIVDAAAPHQGNAIHEQFGGEGFTPVRKDAAFERLHPRDPLNGRWVVAVGGHLSTADATGMSLDDAATRVAEARREGKTATARALHQRGRSMWRPLSPGETKTLADAAAQKLGVTAALPGDVRVAAKDTETHPGTSAVFSTTDNRAFTGTPVGPNDPDQTLYHVSSHARAVRSDGYLTVGKGGGLGAFGKEDSVSFTTKPEVARMLEADMKRNIRFAQIEPRPELPSLFMDEKGRWAEKMVPTKEWKAANPGKKYMDYVNDLHAAENRQREWSERMYKLLQVEAKREGFILPFPPGTDQFKSMSLYTWGDWVNYYYGSRPEKLGGNPVFLGLSYDNGHEVHRNADPRDIGTFRTTLKQATRTGALATRVSGLDEVRVYGDVGVAQESEGGVVAALPESKPSSPVKQGQRFLNEPPEPETSSQPPHLQSFAEFAAAGDTWWHGTSHGAIGKGPDPIHLGNWMTAHEALSTRVAGQHILRSDPIPKRGSGKSPRMIPVRIVKPMGSGVRRDYVGDRQAGEGPSAEYILRGLQAKGQAAHQGYFYRNEREGVLLDRTKAGSGPPWPPEALTYPTSAVVPDASWLKTHEEYVREAHARGEWVPRPILKEYGLKPKEGVTPPGAGGGVTASLPSTFIVGEWVMTRRGKKGQVEGMNPDGTVQVRFGGRSFPMRPGQIVSVESYAHSSRPAR